MVIPLPGASGPSSAIRARPRDGKRGLTASRNLSKLVRSTEDALTDAGAWDDDARIVECRSGKRYPGEGPDALDVPGCRLARRPTANRRPWRDDVYIDDLRWVIRVEHAIAVHVEPGGNDEDVVT